MKLKIYIVINAEKALEELHRRFVVKCIVLILVLPHSITLKENLGDENISVLFAIRKLKKDVNGVNMSISSLFYIKKAAGKYSKIRQKARSKYLASKPHECIVCGYTLHIEVAHIKPISSFPEDTLVSVVNHFDNLAGLCKRCHWEYDNGHVEIMVGAPRIELGT